MEQQALNSLKTEGAADQSVQQDVYREQFELLTPVIDKKWNMLRCAVCQNTTQKMLDTASFQSQDMIRFLVAFMKKRGSELSILKSKPLRAII